MKKIAIVNDKGGVGKSTLTALLCEYLNHCGVAVSLTDTDPNGTLNTYARYAEEEGRRVVHEKPLVKLVDTAGTQGANLRWILEADVIVCPFKAAFADTDVLGAWFASIHQDLRRRVLFVPNMIGCAAEQVHAISDIDEITVRLGAGKLLQPMRNRDAIYPEILKGLPNNFFADKRKRTVAARTEAATICRDILGQAGLNP